MADATYEPKVYKKDGGDTQVVANGGKQEIESGGETDYQSGASLKLDGTAITPTAAEINVLDKGDGVRLTGLIRATYDFAVNGGAVGTIDLGVTVPDNAIIYDGCVEVITTCTSPTTDDATIAIQTEAANDIVTAVAIDTGTPWDAGFREIIPDSVYASNGDWVKMTSAKNVKVVVGVEDLTAGKFVVLLRYMDGG